MILYVYTRGKWIADRRQVTFTYARLVRWLTEIAGWAPIEAFASST